MGNKACYVSTENLDGNQNILKKDMVLTSDSGKEMNAYEYVTSFVNNKIYYEKENSDYNQF